MGLESCTGPEHLERSSCSVPLVRLAGWDCTNICSDFHHRPWAHSINKENEKYCSLCFVLLCLEIKTWQAPIIRKTRWLFIARRFCSCLRAGLCVKTACSEQHRSPLAYNTCGSSTSFSPHRVCYITMRFYYCTYLLKDENRSLSLNH